MKSILYQALTTPFGLKVSTSSVTILRSRLTLARKEDPALSRLRFITSPHFPDSELYIVKEPESAPEK